MIMIDIDPITTAEDWRDTVEVLDAETGELVDLSDCVIKMAVKRHGDRNPILTGSTDDGKITVPDAGHFTWAFPQASRSALCKGSYEVGITISQSEEVMQFLVGTISIIDGVVLP